MTYVTRIPHFLRQFAVLALFIFNFVIKQRRCCFVTPPFSQFLSSECNVGQKLPALFKGRIANPTPANTLLPSVVVACHENFKVPYTQSILRCSLIPEC